MIDKELLDMLACPHCKGDVAEKDGGIVCEDCHRRYPIKNGIPVLIKSEATEPK